MKLPLCEFLADSGEGDPRKREFLRTLLIDWFAAYVLFDFLKVISFVVIKEYF